MTLQQILALPRDQQLSNVALEYQPKGFIADRVLPPIDVVLESAGYYIFDDGNFDIPEMKRNPRGVYKEIDFNASTDTYMAEEYGIASRIDDRERRNAPTVLSLDVSKTRRLTNAALLNRERRVANLVTSTSNVTLNTTLSGTAQFNDPTSSPFGVAKTARAAVRATTGLKPNRLTMGDPVFESLRIHPEVVEFIDGGRATLDQLAEFFEVEEVIVAGALYNTAKEGQTSSLADLWGRDMLFHYQTPTPAIDEPSFGYQFKALDLTVFRWRDVPVNCDVIRVNEIRAEKIVSTRLGYLVKAAVAA